MRCEYRARTSSPARAGDGVCQGTAARLARSAAGTRSCDRCGLIGAAPGPKCRSGSSRRSPASTPETPDSCATARRAAAIAFGSASTVELHRESLRGAGLRGIDSEPRMLLRRRSALRRRVGEAARGCSASSGSPRRCGACALRALMLSLELKPSIWLSSSSIVRCTSRSPESSESKRFVPTASSSSEAK
eukprot:6176620-Pleurochrysis_carterae.AAC.6